MRLNVVSESPLIGRGARGSDVKRSYREAASYLTPNKSSARSINHTSNKAVFAIENIYKMIENCVKMECAGCRKLIPTQLFYDHLNSN